MARTPLKKHSQLMVNAHYGYISKTSSGWTTTRILFSIYDFEWVAWYHFFEVESADVVDGPASARGKYTVFGTPGGGGTAFQPFKPLQVDEFANGPEPHRGNGTALALLSVGSPDNKNLLAMGLTVFLERPQNLELMLNSRGPMVLPARYERGVVRLLADAEEWSPGPLEQRRFHRDLIGHM